MTWVAAVHHAVVKEKEKKHSHPPKHTKTPPKKKKAIQALSSKIKAAWLVPSCMMKVPVTKATHTFSETCVFSAFVIPALSWHHFVLKGEQVS